jgi:hypothetical protein
MILMLNGKNHAVFGITLLCLLFSIMVNVNLAWAQSSKAPAQQWEQDYTIPTSIYDSVKCLVQTSDGGYVFAATLSRGIAPKAVVNTLLVKTNSSGSQEWEKQFGFSGASGLVQTSDGYVLAGQDNASTGTVLFKVDSSGAVQWNHTYSFTGDRSLMIGTRDAGYALTGWENAQNTSRLWFAKTNSVGKLQWHTTYQGYFDKVTKIIQTFDGGYAIVGSLATQNSTKDLVVMKTNSNGNLMWTKHFDAEISYRDDQSIIQTSDGGYVLTDYIDYDLSSDYKHTNILTKTDSDGNVKWNQTFHTLGELGSVLETSDGGLALVGCSVYSLGGNWFVWIVKTDSLGNIEWNQFYGTNTYPLPGLSYVYNNCIIESSDGSLVVAGIGLNGGGFFQGKYFMIKTEPFLPPTTPTPSPLPTVTIPLETSPIRSNLLLFAILIIIPVLAIIVLTMVFRRKQTKIVNSSNLV